MKSFIGKRKGHKIMKIRINVDVASIALGVIIGLVVAPYFYDQKKLKKTMHRGAAKEVVKETKKSLFGRKEA